MAIAGEFEAFVPTRSHRIVKDTACASYPKAAPLRSEVKVDEIAFLLLIKDFIMLGCYLS